MIKGDEDRNMWRQWHMNKQGVALGTV